jgi:hypothetical protein
VIGWVKSRTDAGAVGLSRDVPTPDQDGKDPITGEGLTKEDLIDVVASTQSCSRSTF